MLFEFISGDNLVCFFVHNKTCFFTSCDYRVRFNSTRYCDAVRPADSDRKSRRAIGLPVIHDGVTRVTGARATATQAVLGERPGVTAVSAGRRLKRQRCTLKQCSGDVDI